MSKKAKYVLGVVSVLIVVVGMMLAWPVPDPLAGGRTVYMRWGLNLFPDQWKGSISAEIDAMVGNRRVTLVTDESEADVVLILRSFRISSEEEFITTGTGQAQLEFRAIDTRTGNEHTVDLYAQATAWHIEESKLRTRRFWEFWKG